MSTEGPVLPIFPPEYLWPGYLGELAPGTFTFLLQYCLPLPLSGETSFWEELGNDCPQNES